MSEQEIMDFLESTIHHILREKGVRNKEILRTHSLTKLGFSSLDIVSLIAMAYDNIGIDLLDQDVDLESFDTIESIHELIVNSIANN